MYGQDSPPVLAFKPAVNSVSSAQLFSAQFIKADLVVTGITANSKTYDTFTTATLGGTAAVTALGSDVVTLGGTASGTFANKAAGNNKTVTVTGKALTGSNDDGNYNLIQQSGLTANISKAVLTTTGAVARNKTYDATTAATITGETLAGVLLTDAVSVSGGGTFADKNAGNAKAVTAALALGGTDADNYTLTQPTGLTANIAKADITLAGFTAANKVYDATTAATITAYGSLNGVLLADASHVFAAGGNAVFSDADAGVIKTVRGAGFTLSGNEADNYNLATTSLTNSADITRRPLTVTADAKEKIAGQVDPALTYQTEVVSTGRGLLTGETLSGTLSRTVGETSGAYPIQQGTVDNATNKNYEVAFVSADLTIKNINVPTEQIPLPTPGPPLSVTTIVVPVQPPPLPSFDTAGTPAGETLSGGTSTGGTSTGRIETGANSSSTAASAPGGKTVSGGFTDAKPLTVAQSVATAFIYQIPESTFSHSNPKAVVALDVRLADGSPLPAWMSFDPARKIISGTPPIGSSSEYNISISAKDQFGGEAQIVLKMYVWK